MANPNLSSKETVSSSAEAIRSKDTEGSFKAAKRSSNGALGPADADVSFSMGAALAGAPNNPTCGSRLASRTRSPAAPDPSGALSRKSSGWIVPKTETGGPGNPAAAGPAFVSADLRTNPKSIAAIPSGIARTPNWINASPTRTQGPTSPFANGGTFDAFAAAVLVSFFVGKWAYIERQHGGSVHRDRALSFVNAWLLWALK